MTSRGGDGESNRLSPIHDRPESTGITGIAIFAPHRVARAHTADTFR